MKYVMSTETPYLDKVFIDYLMIRVKNTFKFWDGDFNKTLRCRRSDFKYKFNCFKVELMLINSVDFPKITTKLAYKCDIFLYRRSFKVRDQEMIKHAIITAS